MRRFAPAAALLPLFLPQLADQQEEGRGKRAGNVVTGAGAAAVLPRSGGRVGTIGGRAGVGDAGAPALDTIWFAAPHPALDVTKRLTELP